MRTFLAISLLPIIATFFLLISSPVSLEPQIDHASMAKIIQGEPPTLPEDFTAMNRVLGTVSPTNKRIEVDLTHQRVYAYEGSRKVFDFLVSTGKWGRTPTGSFRIWVKIKSQLMSGGNKSLGTYYYLPNVPWVQFFYNADTPKYLGYSFHGTYWHNNFGHPMSHGCINMETSDAALLFTWTSPPVTNPRAWATYPDIQNPGTEVTIYGTPPAS